MEKGKDQEFVEYVVRAIVNNPDDVKTDKTIDQKGVLITLNINQEDMAQVIGKGGKTIMAVRTLLRIIAAKMDARINLKIAEPEGSTRGPRAEESRPEKNVDDVMDDLKL